MDTEQKESPSRLSPALITVNLQRHSHQKYHPGIFLFTSCRSSSVTFNLCKYLPFANLAFPQQITSSAPTAQQFLVAPPERAGELFLAPVPLSSFPLLGSHTSVGDTSFTPTNWSPGRPGQPWTRSWCWAQFLQKHQQNCVTVIKVSKELLRSKQHRDQPRSTQVTLQEV